MKTQTKYFQDSEKMLDEASALAQVLSVVDPDQCAEGTIQFATNVLADLLQAIQTTNHAEDNARAAKRLQGVAA